MALNSKKRKNKYHELDNMEDGGSFEMNKNDDKILKQLFVSEPKSADLGPKFKTFHENEQSNNADLPKENGKCSSSSERKKKPKNNISFSPKSFKRAKYNGYYENPDNEKNIFFSNLLTDIYNILKDRNFTNMNFIVKMQKFEEILSELSTKAEKISSETVILKLKRLLDLMNESIYETGPWVFIKEAIMKIIDNNNSTIAISPGIESENGGIQENEIAMRESYHEFSVKNLKKMSFVEKRKNKFPMPPLSVQTNSVTKNINNNENPNTNEKVIDSETEDFCEIFKKNSTLIICALLITALICIILII